jgi:hypothetical protein
MGWQCPKTRSLAATIVAAIGVFVMSPMSGSVSAQSAGATNGGQAQTQAKETSATARVNAHADSLYREAREAMINGDVDRSIQLFSTLSQRYPRSQHATAALYFRAFLLYRKYQPGGEPAVLRAALSTLRQLEQKYPNSPQVADGRALQNRICGELAQRGDSVCRAHVVVSARPSKISELGSSSVDSANSNKGDGKTSSGTIVIQVSPGVSVQRDTSCHSEKELDSYVAALNSLWKVDSTRAMTAAIEILNKRDRCLTRLREQTLLMVMQRPTPVLGMAPIIFQVARNDPDSNVKKLATMWLLSQEWEPETAKFLHSIFGQTFRVKTTAKAKASAEPKRE